MSDKIKITKKQVEWFSVANAAGVMFGLYDLIDEIINSVEDKESQDLWAKLKSRVNDVGLDAKKKISFDITDEVDDE